ASALLFCFLYPPAPYVPPPAAPGAGGFQKNPPPPLGGGAGAPPRLQTGTNLAVYHYSQSVKRRQVR
ncbi:hypothetical protein EGK07_07570, partial [Klebsiella pneumoniae]